MGRRTPCYVSIWMDFEAKTLEIYENFENNGQPFSHFHGLTGEIHIADNSEIVNAALADTLLTDHREPFQELCADFFTEFDGSNHKGRWKNPEKFSEFCDQLSIDFQESVEHAANNQMHLSGLAWKYDADDYIEPDVLRDLDIDICTTDRECEKIAENLDETILSEFSISLNDTDNAVLNYRNGLREKYLDKLAYVVTYGAQKDSYCDLADALNAARDTAEEIAENQEIDPETLDKWGDSMETGWGVCPENDAGGYWPQIQAEYEGKRIDKLPWE